MNYGSISNPNTDEGRLYAALRAGRALTAREVQAVTGAAAHTPVISGVRAQLPAGERLLAVPLGTYINERGRTCKGFVYQLVRACDADAVAAATVARNSEIVEAA